MKRNVICFFLALLSFVSNAQVNFEGTIKWSLSLSNSKSTPSTQKELTPQQKAELDKGIAEMEAQLNNPEMKAMFDSNPSMKTMLEQQLATMKSMQGDNGIESLLPKSFIVKMKEGNSYTQIEGGALTTSGDILYIKSSDKTYYIKKTSKTYSVAPKSTYSSSEDTTVSVTATSETAKILNYTCTKYIISETNRGITKTAFIWATKDLKQYNASSFQTKNKSIQYNSTAYKKIDGIPLKIEVTEQGQTVVMEVIELKNMALPAADFILPSDYKEVPYGQ